MVAWFWAFLVTQVVETPIYTRLQPKRGGPSRVAIAFFASAITHPFVWFAFPLVVYAPWGVEAAEAIGVSMYLLMVVLAETFAVLVEAFYLRLWHVPNPLLLALFANAASVTVGFTLRGLFGWP